MAREEVVAGAEVVKVLQTLADGDYEGVARGLKPFPPGLAKVGFGPGQYYFGVVVETSPLIVVVEFCADQVCLSRYP